MFERYTEKARRTIFFARYEASSFGSPYIDTEHLLLGLLREDKSMCRWLPRADPQAIRRRVEDHSRKLAPTSTSVDLPLSESLQRALKSAGNEADRLGSRHIGTEHLLLGLLDEQRCFAAELMRESGADPAAIRVRYAQQDPPPKPWTFQRGSFPLFGFRVLSPETVEIHGSRWNVDYVRDVIGLCRSYNWHWCKAVWKPRDIVIHRKNGTYSFELALAKNDPANFDLLNGGWKKDHCFICRWELFESEDDHGSGYTNGHDWLCTECYTRFWQDPEFFSSCYSDIT